MQPQSLALFSLLLLAAQPATAQRLREIGALPAGYAIADIATGTEGRLFVVGSFEPGDPSRPEADQTDAFAAAFSPDGQELLYLTTWLGRRNDAGVSVAVDPEGAAYVAVRTASANLVGTAGAMQRDFLARDYQSFVAKLDLEGRIVYQTFIGGESNTSVHAVSVRDTGEAAVTGQSVGEGFPTTPGAAAASTDSNTNFIVLLDGEGATALFSVRGVGGSALTIDEAGNVYVGGSVYGRGAVPITPGAYQTDHAQRACAGGFLGISCYYGYVLSLSQDGTEVRFATFLTGDHGSGISAIAVDANGEVLVAGSTYSENFPTTGVLKTNLPAPSLPVPPIIPPPSRGFVAKLSADGTELLFSTILGGSGEDSLSDMIVGSDSILVAGRAGSHDLPGLTALPQCMPSGFVAELSLEGEMRRAIASDRLAAPALAFTGDERLLAGAGNALASVDLAASASRISCINEAATQIRADTIAPGSLLSLFGQGLAPEQLVADPDVGGLFPTTLGGTAVLVGGRHAPLLYVSPEQINLQVPFETELGTAEIALETPDAADPARELAVEPRRPVVFLNSAEHDPCASLYPFYWENTPERSPLPLALNADGTVHSCQNPAGPGTRATIFVTGLGVTDPASATGARNADTPSRDLPAVDLGPGVREVSARPLPGSISSVWKVDFLISEGAHGALELRPTVAGVSAVPERVVLWVD